MAQQRSTAIRYRVSEVRSDDRAGSRGAPAPAEPELTPEQLEEIDRIKSEFIDGIHTLGHEKRLWSDIEVGDALIPNAIGPYSLASFATEWRAYPMTVWGASRKGPSPLSAEEHGYTKEMSGFEGDRRMERRNPELTDGAYYGPSRGHLQPQYARHIGMNRGYGYGASQGAWVLDYAAAWAGEWGSITHSVAQYRNPAYTGDVTHMRGEVVDKRQEAKGRRTLHLVTLSIDLSDQDGKLLAKSTVDVELPAG